MTQYDNTNTGTLFKNDRKTQQNHPDYKGKINIRGEWFWLSGWTKQSNNGTQQFISFAIEEMSDEHQQKNGGRPAPQYAPQHAPQYAPQPQPPQHYGQQPTPRQPAPQYAPQQGGNAQRAMGYAPPQQQAYNDEVPF